ncbi:MAG: 30S ribosomal protein S3 [Eubacterium sp.]|nr:30S ribosomal protein S3 [Eubacterium sp.]
MGQKVSPHGLRVGVIKDWNSKWYAPKDNFADYIAEDHEIRTFIKKKLYSAGVSKVVIERAKLEDEIEVIVAVSRPGMVIGRSGSGTDELKANLEKMTGKKVNLVIREIKKAELDAQLTAESVAEALEHRVSFRRAMKQAIGRTMKSGAKGIKVLVSGRLGGAEIARSEKYSEGNVPLHTLRADIDYGFAEADTTYGRIGVKVWINHGEILDKGLQNAIPEEKQERKERRGRRDDKRRGGKREGGREGGRREGGRRDSRDNKREGAVKTAYARKRPMPKPQEAADQAEAPVETAQDNE